MVISDLSGLPKTAETAVIINAGTKYVTRFALLSTLRHAQVPTIVLDCASRDVSFGWFEHLLADHEFYLMPAKLRLHGQTLDWIFTQIPSDQVLLVDSDVGPDAKK